ncbi:hypothetical protein VTH06DRAFT_3340 [Thermothelomyces fergusii]
MPLCRSTLWAEAKPFGPRPAKDFAAPNKAAARREGGVDLNLNRRLARDNWAVSGQDFFALSRTAGRQVAVWHLSRAIAREQGGEKLSAARLHPQTLGSWIPLHKVSRRGTP